MELSRSQHIILNILFKGHTIYAYSKSYTLLLYRDDKNQLHSFTCNKKIINDMINKNIIISTRINHKLYEFEITLSPNRI